MLEQSNCKSYGCGCSHGNRINFDCSENIPQPVKCKEPDKILSAKDAIDAVFEFFTNPKRKEPEARIIQKLGLKDPQDFNGELTEEFISKVSEKVLEKFEGRLAIIKTKSENECCPQPGQGIEYLVYDTDELPGKSEEDPYADLPAEAKDGIIEDLVGIIEVTPTPKP